MNILDISLVPPLLTNLVQHYLPSASHPNISSYFLRSFYSSLSSHFSQDETSSFFIMQKDLPVDTQSRLTLLVKRLKNLRSLEFREKILYILSSLKEDKSIAIPTTRLETLKLPYSVSPQSDLNLIDFTRDLVFAFQGIDSRNFAFSESSDLFSINSITPAPLHDLSSRLLELGWLYKKIAAFISKSIKSLNSVILQSLAYAVQKQIGNSYLRFLAILHNSIENQPSFVKKIWNIYNENLESLKWIGIICDGVEGLKGGEIVSALFNYWRHGSESIQTLIRPLLEEAGIPLLQMIRSWMIEGEFNDTFHEFFIIQDYSVSRKKLWSGMFKINNYMVPCFFSEDLTKKILLTGKSLYFLRKECYEEEWSENVAEIRSIVGIEKAESHWINRVSDSTNEKLINVLFGKYRLQEHCVMIRKYLLMNQGDFHHTLIEGVYETLDLPAAKVYKHSLISILEAAVKSSNCQYHDNEFVNRLRVVLEDSKGKHSGWDIFSLDYYVEAPLSTFFSEEICAKYRQIYVFLLKIKRIHYLINSLERMKFLIKMQNEKDYFPMLRKMNFIGNHISHFINIFSNYVMVDSIEGLWAKFYLNVCNAKDLDELNHLHLKFVNDVLESCFMSVDETYSQILKILGLCLEFCLSKESFVKSVKVQYKARSKPDWDDLKQYYVKISHKSYENIQKVSDVFPEEVIKFIELLERNDSVRHKNLGVVLDFNEYYLHESLRRGGYSEYFEGYKGLIQGLNIIARR